MKRLTLLSFIFFSIVAHAEGLNIKPGLWEVQHDMNVNGQKVPDIKEMIAKVPPEMREQMKAMMTKNGTGMTDKGMTICISAEQIARGEMGQQNPNSLCKTTKLQHSGDKTTMTLHCDAPHQADGTTELTRISDKQWQSATHLSTTKGLINSNASGKWLSADCGDIKPLEQKKN